MKLPRNVNGRDLADHLIRRWDYRQTRQNGSHILLESTSPVTHSVTVPAHRPLKIGTLASILDHVASHKLVSVAVLLERL